MSGESERQADSGSGVASACARDPNGRFARVADVEAPRTPEVRRQKRRARTERDYMRRIVAELTESDVATVVASIKRDAVGGPECDPKTVNAAREWIGKYVLGNARFQLGDLNSTPAIVKRR
jgi:hypothetical protein